MNSQHPHSRVGFRPKPFPALRRPSSLLKSTNPTAPPDRTTPQRHDITLHQIPITYSTIAVRALSFHRQVRFDVTPLQLAQNGLYCKLLPDSGGSACCLPADRLGPCTHYKRILSKRYSNSTWKIWDVEYRVSPRLSLGHGSGRGQQRPPGSPGIY